MSSVAAGQREAALGQVRPSGAQMTCGTNGLSPWKIACGHHSNDHMNEVGSPLPAQAQTELGCTRAPRPNKTTERLSR